MKSNWILRALVILANISYSMIGLGMQNLIYESDETFRNEPFVRRANDSSVKLAWWNIQRGETNAFLEQTSGERPLDSNLVSYVTSEHGPDILVFGEYTEGAISNETLKVISENYPHQEFVAYNEQTPEMKIAIFSKFKLKAKESIPLDYVPADLSETEEAMYRLRWSNNFVDERYFKRTLTAIHFEVSGQKYTLIPVHTAMPWLRLLNAHYLP